MSEKAGRVAGDTHDDKSNIMWRERKGWLEPYCTVQSVQDIVHTDSDGETSNVRHRLLIRLSVIHSLGLEWQLNDDATDRG